MRFWLVWLSCAVASVLHAPIESFDIAAVAEMDHTLGTMFVSATVAANEVESSEDVGTTGSEDAADVPTVAPLLNISELSDHSASAARQAIYHETTSAARLRLLIIMNQVYSSWALAHNHTWSVNPKRRCDAIRSLLEYDMSSVPARYREDTISGWLLFCGHSRKI